MERRSARSAVAFPFNIEHSTFNISPLTHPPMERRSAQPAVAFHSTLNIQHSTFNISPLTQSPCGSNSRPALFAPPATMLPILQIILTALACGALWWFWSRTSGSGKASLIITAGFLLRAVAGQILFWISWLHLPIARSLQLGNGFWFFATDGPGYLSYADELIGKGWRPPCSQRRSIRRMSSFRSSRRLRLSSARLPRWPSAQLRGVPRHLRDHQPHRCARSAHGASPPGRACGGRIRTGHDPLVAPAAEGHLLPLSDHGPDRRLLPVADAVAGR